jgi:hypothetical protein
MYLVSGVSAANFTLSLPSKLIKHLLYFGNLSDLRVDNKFEIIHLNFMPTVLCFVSI